MPISTPDPRAETLAVHAGRGPDPATGAVTLPLQLSTNFARDADGRGTGGFEYARDANPARAALEAALMQLEGGTDCIAFSSGMAAIAAVLHCLPAATPRRLLLPRDLYWGLPAQLADTPLGTTMQVRQVDMQDLAATAQICTEWRPGLVWLETPSNPLLEVVDIAAIAAIARGCGAWLVADNTFASPALQCPLRLGVHAVVESATKYIGGHGDLMLGAVILADADAIAGPMRLYQTHQGAVPSPFDCWLALRSLASLPVRMDRHCANAGRVADFLVGAPGVAGVHYPGRATHANHDVAARQMAGFGGMLSFRLAGGVPHARAVAAGLKLITRATSFGDAKSLIEQRLPAGRVPPGLLRLSVGLEHADDIIADLADALSSAGFTG